jgi:hypothetical protein
MLKQSIACRLFTGTFAGMFASASDDSSTLSAAAPGGAITQQQKQQVYFLLPSLLLYWSAYRPVTVASYAQAGPVYPIATADSALADQAARAAMILAHQQGQWLLPLDWCQAAVIELPPLFSCIGQCLLQPAGTAPATGSSSSSSQQVPTFCADPPSAALTVASCMGYLYAAISGSVTGPICSNESVGLGPQHAGAAHQLVEFAVRNKPLLLRGLPVELHMLLQPGSV